MSPDPGSIESTAPDRPPIVVPPDVQTDPRDDPQDAAAVEREASTPDASVTTDASTPPTPAKPEWKPATPEGPLPDCRDQSFQLLPTRDVRWIVMRAQPAPQGALAAYLIQVTAEGLTQPVLAGRIGTDSELGIWSSDGRHFALWSSDGIQRVRVDGATTLAAAPIPGRLYGFAPTRSSLLVSDLSLFKLYDAEQFDAAPRKAPMPYGSISNWFWSRDGRYFGFSAPEAAQPGLRRLDLDAEPLTFEAPFAELGSNLQWSPDGRYLAFTRSVGSMLELWLADWISGSARVRRAATALGTSANTFGKYSWLDPTHLIWEDPARQVHALAIQDEQLSTSKLFELPQYGSFQVSPGGACVAFPGDCTSATTQGLCVLSTREPVRRALVSRDSFTKIVWQDNGARLAVVRDRRIEVVNLDGAAFAPVLATKGDEFDYLDQWAWAPNGAPWIAYRATRINPQQRSSVYLWNVTTQQTSTLAPDGLSPQSVSWSPDARYLAILARDPGSFAATRAPLLLQRIEAQTLGPLWTSPGTFFTVPSARVGDLVFQP
jgi:dipeptidyl aminopeptidase/acylaminoacyl peptidase